MPSRKPKTKSSDKPKNIVLLSDGTGNSSAELHKTNVWRAYRCLDGKGQDQIALYDDGVGTSQFRPLALAGGIFGWGLERNVRKLYEYLCWNYRPGDSVYGFGFSRGAFTIRMLVGLIENQGLVDRAKCKNDNDFYRRIRHAQWEFRGNFNSDGGRVQRGARALFNLVRKLPGRRLFGRKVVPYDKSKNHQPFHSDRCRDGVKVRFLGLWDTVDAYGGPVDELTRGWDRWIWPLKLRNKHLWSGVEKACHALALDDERSSFSPQLWNEMPLEKTQALDSNQHQAQDAKNINEERISQVWFAGMHSDVGGGYPDESLSLVSFKWIMECAKAKGLKLREDAERRYYDAADAYGTMHNSRSGLGLYYRYQPRRIDALIEDDKKVSIERHKVHSSVFDRIRSSAVEYSPIVLPQNYAVVKDDGSINKPDGKTGGFERVVGAKLRIRLQERIWDLVWWRKFCYYGILVLSFTLALLPWIEYLPWRFWPLSEVKYATTCNVSPVCFLSDIPRFAGNFLPSFMSKWIDTFSANPGVTALLTTFIALLVVRSKNLSFAIENAMTRIWEIAGKEKERESERKFRLRATKAQVLRKNRLLQSLIPKLKFKFMPAVFGISSLAILGWMFLILPGKFLFSSFDATSSFCQQQDGKKVQSLRNPAVVQNLFDYRVACFATGFNVDAGAKYQIAMVVGDPRSEAMIARADFAGKAQMNAFLDFIMWPMRRHPEAGYHQTVLRIAPPRPSNYSFLQKIMPVWIDDIPLNSAVTFSLGRSQKAVVSEFTAKSSGELYLYVNDAVFIWPSITYENNVGQAKVAMQRIYLNKPPENLLSLLSSKMVTPP